MKCAVKRTVPSRERNEQPNPVALGTKQRRDALSIRMSRSPLSDRLLEIARRMAQFYHGWADAITALSRLGEKGKTAQFDSAARRFWRLNLEPMYVR